MAPTDKLWRSTMQEYRFSRSLTTRDEKKKATGLFSRRLNSQACPSSQPRPAPDPRSYREDALSFVSEGSERTGEAGAADTTLQTAAWNINKSLEIACCCRNAVGDWIGSIRSLYWHAHLPYGGVTMHELDRSGCFRYDDYSGCSARLGRPVTVRHAATPGVPSLLDDDSACWRRVPTG